MRSAAEAFVIDELAAGRIANVAAWAASTEHDPEVSGGFVRDLMLRGFNRGSYGVDTAPDTPDTPDTRAPSSEELPIGVAIIGARIRETIDLSDCGSTSAPLPRLLLRNCTWFDDLQACPLNLAGSHISALDLRNSEITKIEARGATIYGHADLSDLVAQERTEYRGCHCNFARCKIKGDFSARRSRFSSDPLLEDTLANGAIASEPWVETATGLNLNWARIDGSLFLSDSDFFGGLVAAFSKIGDNADLDGVQLTAPEHRRVALSLEGAEVNGSLSAFASNRTGQVRKFVCDGVVYLFRLSVSGSLAISAASLGSHSKTKEELWDGVALYAQDAQIGGSLYFRAVDATGRLLLDYIKVGGHAWLEDISIQPLLPLAGSFATGRDSRATVFLSGARIGKELRLDAGTMPERLREALHWEDSNNRFRGGLDLRDLTAGKLCDSFPGYGDADPILVEGLVYERLDSSKITPKQRVGRILSCGGKEHATQPYAQLAQTLAHEGRESDVRSVLVEKAWRDARKSWLKFQGQSYDQGGMPSEKVGAYAQLREGAIGFGRAVVYWIFLFPFGILFGFGLSPGRALATFLTSIVLGSLFFLWTDYRGAMVVDQLSVATLVRGDKFIVPVVDESDVDISVSTRCDRSAEVLIYAVDVFIPLLDLSEESACTIGAANGSNASILEIAVYRHIKAIYAIVGWIVTALAILTFSGVVRNRLLHE